MENIFMYAGIGAAVLFAVVIFWIAVMLRRVVPTNEVHIVQSQKTTRSYGKDYPNGNCYYEWPSWVPIIGVSKMELPVSVFNLALNNYEAYDKGRLPFIVDIMAFFRVEDSNIAAQRVSSFVELNNQLKAIVQGAARTILASSDIEEIMQGRSKFGNLFTEEVKGQLVHWGVSAVKNIELMDIRDAQGSNVIQNIMAKKKSFIEMESRQEVAKNSKAAKIAEIEAQREIELQTQQAKQQVGLRTVENERFVNLAKQEADQVIKDQEKITKEKEMAVAMVQQTRAAEIEKSVQMIRAGQNKEVTIVAADAQLEAKKRDAQAAVVVAEGQLETKKREAQATQLQGEATAVAAKAMQLAPVEAQIVLAKEIGSNDSYQKYLIALEQIKANLAIGVEQAKALEKAGIKIIANAGDPVSGVNKVMDLFSSGGGQQVGSMLEGIAQTDMGRALLNKFLPSVSKPANPTAPGLTK